MDFFDWQGARRRHSRRYANNQQRRQTEKDAMSCRVLGRDWQHIRLCFSNRPRLPHKMLKTDRGCTRRDAV